MTLTVTVADVHRMTPDVKQFRLVADEHTFEYDPGQHTMVHFESDGEEEARPYTAANLPGTNQLILAIKRYDDGTGSVFMHERTPGDEIEVEEVDGNLHVRDFDRDAVFLATGTGITPLYPMVKQYAREGEGDARLVFGERDQEHLIFRESLDQLRAEEATLDVDYVLSDAESEAWNGRTGHVQDHLPDALDGLDVEETDFYVCGVPEMVVETEDLLVEAGADEDRIFTEGWESDAAEE
ncbi:FAD-dependent oxidoreductase [Halogeometricum sp. S1BR25-6]|uniref:FAD-dependent oxidoreductase n=1 Tax=Halogeometricum salsisoli TaxID=2950536 RepID=A0ABU2GEU1_9EURY|nr:FAD-dependent oxidoreductase [Halogeometricum sp. S1BR25-6]MDS0299307.1 FAD-dependent oxidoreductase [Halogeometricum sp. S1BR25-6]